MRSTSLVMMPFGKRGSQACYLQLVAGDKFKVFISWSGGLAKTVAAVWADLLVETFDAVAPFMSEENIGAGERGLAKIATELAGTGFGIIVVTQENQNSPWLNYEAGALSKDLGDETVRVAPCLVDFPRKNDATGPLSQFQATLLDEAGVERILLEIAKVVRVDEVAIKRRFQRSWEEYDKRFKAAKSAHPTTPHRRQDPEMLDEILTIVRDLARSAEAADPVLVARELLKDWVRMNWAGQSPDESTIKPVAETWIPLRVPAYVPTLQVGDSIRLEDETKGYVKKIQDATRPGEYPTAVVEVEQPGNRRQLLEIPCKKPSKG